MMTVARISFLASLWFASALLALSFAHADPPDAAAAACQSGDGAACLRLGESAYSAGNSAAALDAYARACAAGRGLGCMHLGRGLEPDAQKRPGWLEKGFLAFKKACEASEEPEGCYFLGISYENGSGIKRNPQRALSSYHRGCELGSAAACTNEAGDFMIGRGTKKDTGRAAALYALACDRDDNYACYWLGYIHEQELHLVSDRSHVETVPLQGAEADMIEGGKPPRESAAARGPAISALFKEPVDKLRAGCESGRGLDCYKLGVMAQTGGASMKKSDAQAASYYEKACDAGSGWGCMRAGDSYWRGYGVPANLGKAAHYYLKVCNEGVGGEEGYKEECRGIMDRMGL